MAKPLVPRKRVVPQAFSQYCHARFERTVQLTQQALDQLQAEGQPVTLAALSAATRAFDAQGHGLSPNTILRNPRAAELFRQHSPAYQRRQHRTRRAKRKRPSPGAEVRATYRGLRPSDLISLVEELKMQISELQAQQERLRVQRDEAYRLAIKPSAKTLGSWQR